MTQAIANQQLSGPDASERPRTAHPAETAVELPELLRRVSGEISGLSDQIHRLQHSLSDLLVNADWVLVEEAQALDHVCQHMAELAQVVTRTAGHAPAQAVPVEAILEGVPLSGLVHRLSGRPAEAQDSGEVELL